MALLNNSIHIHPTAYTQYKTQFFYLKRFYESKKCLIHHNFFCAFNDIHEISSNYIISKFSYFRLKSYEKN